MSDLRRDARTVLADRTRFLVREEGSGDGVPIVLLHGVPETSSCWRAIAPRLANGRRVLAPDLPGLGGSSYAGPYDVPSLVAQLSALIDAELPGGQIDLVGHDWGGSLALALTAHRPGLVRRLVVANAPYRKVPLPRAFHVPLFALPVLPEAAFRLGGARLVDAMIGYAWASARTLDPDVQAEYRAAYTDPQKVNAMLGYYRGVARPQLARMVGQGRPKVPAPRVRAERMMVLWGSRDPVLPVSTGEQVVRELGADATMVTVPAAGHFVIEEAPEVVGDVLAEFLRDDPAADPRETVAPPPPEQAGRPD